MDDGFFDMPAGYRDADLEMASLESAGNAAAALERRGGCAHGYRQGARGANDPALAGTPSHGQRVDAVIPAGMDLCLRCGKSVPAW